MFDKTARNCPIRVENVLADARGQRRLLRTTLMPAAWRCRIDNPDASGLPCSILPGTHTMLRRTWLAATLAALPCLAARDGIWVIATLRSDYLPLLAELPELAAELDEVSWFPLQPPATARIRQVIEIPARIAAIDYEESTSGTGRGLVDVLETEASLLTHWPPVLQEVLEDLYRRAARRLGDSDGIREPGNAVPTGAVTGALRRESAPVTPHRIPSGVPAARPLRRSPAALPAPRAGRYSVGGGWGRLTAIASPW